MSQVITARGQRYTESLALQGEECCNCGVMFAMPASLVRRAQADPSIWFYCPSGHRQHYTGDSAETKLRNAEAKLSAQGDQLKAAVRDAETLRFALLRDRQRFANGVCPCCNRSFDNVRRHMSTKHPDYDVTRVQQPSTVKFSCSCGRSFETVRGLRIHQGSRRGDNWDEPGKSRWQAHLTNVG